MHGGHFRLCLRCMGINNLDKYYFMLSPVLISCLLTEGKTQLWCIYILLFVLSFLVGRNKNNIHHCLHILADFHVARPHYVIFPKKKTESWRKTHRREKYQAFTVYKTIWITWSGMAWRHFSGNPVFTTADKYIENK